MPAFGGSCYFPRRLGGGTPPVKVLRESLNASRGSSRPIDFDSYVYAENNATARCLNSLWASNARLGHLNDPDRMPVEILKRWERILKLAPLPADTLPVRRLAVKKKFAQAGKESYLATVETAVRVELGELFSAIEFLDISEARIISPSASYPYGIQNTAIPWSSNVCKVLVRTTYPDNYPTGAYIDAIKGVRKLLDDLLPVWCTFVVFHAPIGGVTSRGIFCDTPSTLDFCVFRI